MSTSVTSGTKPRLAPLQCVNCNAPLAVEEAPSLVPRFAQTPATDLQPQITQKTLRNLWMVFLLHQLSCFRKRQVLKPINTTVNYTNVNRFG